MLGRVGNRDRDGGVLLVTERQAAKALGVSARTIWGLADSGDLPCVRIGRAKRYDIRDIDAFIRRQKSPAPAREKTPAAGGQTGAPELQNENITNSGM